jgi:hypothetical protein
LIEIFINSKNLNSELGISNVPLTEASNALKIYEASPAVINEHRLNVNSDDPIKQLQSTQHFRRLLSIGIF